MGRPKRPRDINQLAASIVAEATREDAPTQEPDTRNPHAVLPWASSARPRAGRLGLRH